MANPTIGIRFLYEFSLGMYNFSNPGSNVLSVTSQAAGDHEKVNLTTSPLRQTYRSADVAGWQEIIIEVNDQITVADTIAILNHNLTEIAAVEVQFSTDPSFAVIAATLPMVWREKHMVLLQDIGQAYRYWRFRFLDPTNPCGYIEIGRIVAGKAFTVTNDEDITDSFQVGLMDKAYKMNTEGFFRASNERVKIERLSMTFDKLWTTKTVEDPTRDYNYLGLMRMFKSVGETMPFLTILDPEDTEFFVMWGQIDTLPTRGFTINRYVSIPLTIEEVY